MKKIISTTVLVFLLFSTIFAGIPQVCASSNSDTSRAIAIVFDNSGSMYDYGDQSWCRATYATEVFASMLNAGDVLQIYPMNPFKIGEVEYTMDNPFQITDASQAYLIREIYTPDVGDTHIESIDRAVSGLQNVQAGQKYMIVLSDGDVFYRNRRELSQNESRNQLDAYFQNANNDIRMMYLGIGDVAIVPNTPESDFFTNKQAKNSADVLSALTDMCNRIFGRDIMPKSRVHNGIVEFDVSISKLIVFVQGENISDLRLVDSSGAEVGQLAGTQQTKYSTAGCGAYNSKPDTTLQGMMVTYTDCSAGSYNLNYTGTATNIEIYYEPDADLDFVFTDAAGNNVDPNALYEGEYKVSFGMKDAKTGKLISSDLLGNPHYQGSYYINGQAVPITHEGYGGEVPVALSMNDTFEAELTVTYLSGYSITKDTTDFGWPEGGIQVIARPAGELVLEITGGDEVYSLQDLEEGSTYTATVYYQGTQLTGEELQNVELKWEPEKSNAEILKEFSEDHYKLSLHYKDPEAPQNTACGECTVFIYAYYTAKGSNESQAQSPLKYNIVDDYVPLEMELYVPEDYIVISELEDSQAIVAKLTMNGEPLSQKEFDAVEMVVDCGGIEHTVTACAEDSSYLIKLMPTEGIKDGDYPINITAKHTDHIGRVTQTDDSAAVTLSTMPLWLKWAIGLLGFIILAIIIWIISRIRVLPKYAHTTRKLSSMNFDGETVTTATNFTAEIKKKQMKVQSQYGGRKFGVTMDVVPGKDSYLFKPQTKRSALVNPTSVRKFGPAKIQEVMIGSTKYEVDGNGKLVPALPNQKPFVIKNGMMVKYSGTISDAGVDKDFESVSKLNFKKK